MSAKLTGKTMRELVAAYGGAMRPGENLKGWINRVARSLNESPRMVRAAWSGEIKNPDHRLKWKLTDALRRRADAAEAQGRVELEELQNRIAALESRLMAIDPDFHSATLTALGAAMRRSRTEDRAGDRD